jgi:DNA-binding MarR family transcriptional regulator
MATYDSSTFNPDVSVGYLAKRIHQASLVGLEPAFSGENISYVQWAALVSVWYGGNGTTCKAVARDLAYDRGATTRLLDTLEERGLLGRERDPEDRRSINLTLTEEGHAIAERCMSRVVDLWNGWLSGWDQADVARLIGYLQRLRADLEAATEDKS